MNLRFSYILIATISLLSFAIFFAVRPIQVAYHKWRMDEERERIEVVQQYASDPGAAESYQHHRAALVRLGHISKIEYEFRNVTLDSNMGNQIWHSILMGNCPDKIDAEMPHYPDRRPLTIDVWCKPNDESAWTQFLKSYDQPN